jgi:flagellar M-ring protein FliF
MDPQAAFAALDPSKAMATESNPTGWRERLQALSPAARGAIALAGIVVVAAAIWAAQGTSEDKEQRILFSNVSGADGAAIVAALEQMNVPYKFTEGGSAITVPKSLVYETRLKLAGQGLPKSGTVGFEILEKQKFGTSQFVERVNYLRGLEGELARSMTSIGQVKAARVHLAVPKQTSFTREQERPSASVLLTLHPGRVLEPSQTAAIARLVSSSVPGMQVQDVAILDTDGGNLVSALPRTDLDAGQLKYTREVEASLTRRLADLLTPLAGPNGFRAQVTVDLSFDEREKTSEVYSRNAGDQSIRSEQTLEAGERPGGPQGIPGALTNQPPVPPEAPIVNQAKGGNNQSAAGGNAARELNAPGRVETGQAQSDSAQTRRERTVNYEVDRSIERFKPSKGQIRRISAAVVLDYKPAAGGGSPRSPYTNEELRQINTLVRDAVGYVQARGDTVSVANLSFNAPPAGDAAPLAAESVWTPELIDQIRKIGLMLLGAALVYFLVLRPLLKPKPAPPAPAPVAPEPWLAQKDEREQHQREIEEKEQAWARQREVWAAEERLREQEDKLRKDKEEQLQADRKKQLDELMGYANGFAQQDPEQTALLLKSWASSKPPVGAAPARAATSGPVTA